MSTELLPGLGAELDQGFLAFLFSSPGYAQGVCRISNSGFVSKYLAELPILHNIDYSLLPQRPYTARQQRSLPYGILSQNQAL